MLQENWTNMCFELKTLWVNNDPEHLLIILVRHGFKENCQVNHFFIVAFDSIFQHFSLAKIDHAKINAIYC